jgi:hemoglobin
MEGRKDILSRADIERFIRSFYEKVIEDETIGVVFTEVVKMNWDHHIPLITDFWETILLDNPVYKKNAMEVHYQLNHIFPLQKKHFDAWLLLFNTTLDAMYEGPVTELAKKRASGISAVMQFKMNNPSIL